MSNVYYLCVNREKKCEHRPFVEPSERYPDPNCICGGWYEEVTKEEYSKTLDKKPEKK